MTNEEFDLQYASHLNTQQREAVHAVDGAILLLAVPGSGKTTVLVTRLGYMVYCRGIPADKILTMTYTVAATREMQQRFASVFGAEFAKALEFRTINGVSSKIIAYYSRTRGKGPAFRLLDNEGELSHLVAGVYQEVCGEFATPSAVKEIRTAITYVKNRMLTAQEISTLDLGISKFPELYRRYCLELKRGQFMDYDDQMAYALAILERYPDILAHFQDQYPYLCVDESQDTSKIQHAIIRLLAKKHGNLFMVGDEDQSIYGFRAAYPEALVRFEEEYPGAAVMLMEENYRSTKEILLAADAFISKNKNRRPKTLHSARGAGTPVRIIHTVHPTTQLKYLYAAAQDCGRETAVLYRNNDSALPLIDLFERSGTPYNCRRFDDTFFTHRIVTDIRDIVRFSRDPENAQLFLGIYYKLNAYISKEAAEFACRESRERGVPILTAMLGFPGLSGSQQERVTDLSAQLALLERDGAETGLRRLWLSMGYSGYVEKMGLDKGKYTTLCMLAQQEQTLWGLLRRLDELRQIIAAHENSDETKFLLSTIHSSKGLEYDRVYLLDALDGTLPSEPRPDRSDPEKLRQYEEDRRIFYVAITRAKNALYLFHCKEAPSAFVDEIMAAAPGEVGENEALFRPLRRNLCGKAYRHRQWGQGQILAHCGDQLLLEYGGAQLRLSSLAQLWEEREISGVASDPAAPGKAAGAPQAEEFDAAPGRTIHHATLGPGTILRYQAPYITIRFQSSEKMFHLPDSLRRGFLNIS